MAVELQHFRHIVAIAQYGSLKRAADALGLKQSTLSRSITELEEELGVILFERGPAGTVPTNAGRELLVYAQSILQATDAAILRLKKHGKGKTGRLTLGFYTSLSAGNLRATIGDYLRRFPEIEVATSEGSRTELLAGLSAGIIDVLVMTGSPSNNLNRTLPLWSERLVVALPEVHRLAAKSVVDWSELRGETFLFSLCDAGTELKNLLMSKFTDLGDIPNIILHDVGVHKIKGLVSAGLGISVTWESCTGEGYAGIVYRQVHDGSGPSHVSFTAHWRKSNENPALKSFLDILRERYPDFSSPLASATFAKAAV